MKIKGKDYVPVNERLKEFRKLFKDYSLTSEIIELTPEVCTIKAVITDDKGVVRATGLAQELRNNSMSLVNKTSYVENCETSAWGRALGNFGIGIDSAICTADELLMALNAQKEPEKPAKAQTDPFKAVASSMKSAATRAGKYELSDADIVEKAQKSSYNDEELATKTQGAIDYFNALNTQLLATDAKYAGAKLLIEINNLRENFTAADALKNALNAAIERTNKIDDSIPY